ncbi:Uncharacterized protein ChrSV_3647 [Chromobacterium vaccinii]|nr:Uncharacterized protein ChrSW_3647 [Chromobacterium vaccinii]QND91104.1 Uncharacterized protein ChrSV_3647 [Chromobacterium vaccinii]
MSDAALRSLAVPDVLSAAARLASGLFSCRSPLFSGNAQETRT